MVARAQSPGSLGDARGPLEVPPRCPCSRLAGWEFLQRCFRLGASGWPVWEKGRTLALGKALDSLREGAAGSQDPPPGWLEPMAGEREMGGGAPQPYLTQRSSALLLRSSKRSLALRLEGLPGPGPQHPQGPSLLLSTDRSAMTLKPSVQAGLGLDRRSDSPLTLISC